MGYDPRRLQDVHLPACSCWRCAQRRLARLAAEEEERGQALENPSKSRPPDQPQGQGRRKGFPPSVYKPSTPSQSPNPPVSQPSGTPSSRAGGTRINSSHPESCPCGICSRDRQIEEALRRQAQNRGQGQSQTAPAPSSTSPQPSRNPALGDSGGRNRPSSRPPCPPRNWHPADCVCVDCRRQPKQRHRQPAPPPRSRPPTFGAKPSPRQNAETEVMATRFVFRILLPAALSAFVALVYACV